MVDKNKDQDRASADSQNAVLSHAQILEVDKSVLEEHKVASHLSKNFISDQYEVLKANLLEKTAENGLRTVLITSSSPGEGKTLTAVNLAISLSCELSQRVLLVDADLRKPSIHALFGLNPKVGLADYLLRDVPLEDIFIDPGMHGLLLLPGIIGIKNPSEVVRSSKMESLVKELKERHPDRYVIFDSAPLIGLADSLILSKYVDGVLLVIRAGKTSKDQVTKSLSILENRNLLGFVLNKVNYMPKKYGSAYSY